MIFARFRRLFRTAATLKRRVLGEADYKRWRDAKSFDTEWDERAKIIAGIIPRGSRVIEFGAGLSKLRSHLDSSCTYVGSDLISRRPDTLMIDLEQRPFRDFSNRQFDIAVFAGVLEYLSDVPGVASWVGQYVTACICSYECAPRVRQGYDALKQTWNRAALGWVNAYTEEQLKIIFGRAGFVCSAQDIWNTKGGDEPIFLFSKTHPGETQSNT